MLSNMNTSDYIKSQLKELPCPCNWVSKDVEIPEEESFFTKIEGETQNDAINSDLRKSFAKCLLLAYRAFVQRDMGETLSYLVRAKELIYNDDSFKNIINAYEHVINAFKAHILFEKNEIQECQEMIELAKKDVDDKSRCLHLCIQAHFYKIYKVSNDVLVSLMEKALKLNPDEPESNFLMAYALSRMRHRTLPRVYPSEKELFHIKKAYQAVPSCQGYAIFFARVYCDMLPGIHYDDRELYKSRIMEIIEPLLKDYKNLNGTGLARCLFYLWKCNKYKPTENIEEYISTALSKNSEDKLAHHYIGTYYIKNKKYKEAYDCFSVATKEIPYTMGQMLLIQWRLDKKFNAANYIQTIVPLYEKGSANLWNIYFGAAEYYLLVEGNIQECLKYVQLGLDCDNLTDYLTTVSSYRVSFQSILFEELSKKRFLDHNNDEIRQLRKRLGYFSVYNKFNLLTLKRTLL